MQVQCLAFSQNLRDIPPVLMFKFKITFPLFSRVFPFHHFGFTYLFSSYFKFLIYLDLYTFNFSFISLQSQRNAHLIYMC